jgi:hypothetical protein
MGGRSLLLACLSILTACHSSVERKCAPAIESDFALRSAEKSVERLDKGRAALAHEACILENSLELLSTGLSKDQTEEAISRICDSQSQTLYGYLREIPGDKAVNPWTWFIYKGQWIQVSDFLQETFAGARVCQQFGFNRSDYQFQTAVYRAEELANEFRNPVYRKISDEVFRMLEEENAQLDQVLNGKIGISSQTKGVVP